MVTERRLYDQLKRVLNEEGDGDGVAVLEGDGGRSYVISINNKGAIVVSGGKEENVILPDGSRVVILKS